MEEMMSPEPIVLSSFVNDLIAMPSDGATAYFNRSTGDIHVFVIEIRIVERDEPTGCHINPEELQVKASPDYLLLPDKFEIDERHMIKRFCASIDDYYVRDRLFDSFHGKGKFRRFKNALDQFNLQQDWYAFQENEYKKVAIRWLELNEVPYIDDMD
jgi:hypothetical protein